MTKNNDITVYQWWGNENEPPEHLKTKKQLVQIGLKPREPVGVIYCTKYDLYLYDPSNPKSATKKRKATEKQLKALAKGREKQRYKQEYREWFNNWGHIIKAKNEAILRAREILNDKNNWLILDTETTGVSDAEIVEIGIINLDGETLFNSLVKPTEAEAISNDATMIHGITNEMVRFSPTFPQIYHEIKSIIENKIVGIYNADFDISMLNYCCQKHNLEKLTFDYDCIMVLYARYYGDYSDYYKDYKWQPLNGGHRAIDDCLATLELIKEMANLEVTESLKLLFEKHYQPRDIYLKNKLDIIFSWIFSDLKTLETIVTDDISEKDIKAHLSNLIDDCKEARSILGQIKIKI